MSRLLPVLLMFAVLAPRGQAQTQGDERMGAYLSSLTEQLSGRFLDGARSRAEWEARRPRLHQEYLDMLGLWPLPERTPLHATVTGTLEHEGVTIEKLHYQSRPGLYVTANLYRPTSPQGRLPAILYACGHSARGRDGNKTAFQDHGLWFARNGYLCLMVDTLQLGEIAGIHHGTYREGRWWWQALGYTPAGVECWNGIRGLDYLVSRPDVDPERLGVTGISGGGAATFWIAAADSRVKVAVPVSGMSDLESYVKNRIINGHCDCMFLVNTYAWEWTTIAALIAPRPMLFANSDRDPIFPMDGNRRIMTRLRDVYKLLGHPEWVDEYVSSGGHDYRPDLRVAVFSWFHKHLKKDATPVQDTTFKVLPGLMLRAFPTDSDLPRDARNGRIDETFVSPAVADKPLEKKATLAWLRAHSFRGLPETIPAATVPGQIRGDKIRLVSESGIEVALNTLRRGDEAATEGTLIVSDGDDVVTSGTIPEWAKSLVGAGPVLALQTRGSADPWTRRSPPNTVERAHALLGRTVDEGRVRDIVATVRYLTSSPNAPARRWRLVGQKQAGVLAAYAALFEPSIKALAVVDPPVSHRQGPIFLNVLRKLDIPEALGLLAPEVTLTLRNAHDPAFDRVRAAFERAGAAKQYLRE